jgi:hypothetical protein
LILRRRACENFFRPRADSTLDVTDSSLFCHARVGEGKETSSFLALLAKKNFSHSSAYAPLRRKTKRARRKVRQRQRQRQNNKKISHNTARPLRRKIKRARARARHGKDKDNNANGKTIPVQNHFFKLFNFIFKLQSFWLFSTI